MQDIESKMRTTALMVGVLPDGSPSSALPRKNIAGELGPRCADCSGLGSVARITLGAQSRGLSTCNRCLGTGVEPLSPMEQRELLERLRRMETEKNGGGDSVTTTTTP